MFRTTLEHAEGAHRAHGPPIRRGCFGQSSCRREMHAYRYATPNSRIRQHRPPERHGERATPDPHRVVPSEVERIREFVILAAHIPLERAEASIRIVRSVLHE